MGGVDTIGGASQNIFWAMGQVAFGWVPATFAALFGLAPGTNSPLTFVPQPVTPGTITDYLASSASPETVDSLYRFWGELVAFSIIVSIIMAALVVYCAMRILEVRRHEWERFAAAAHPVAAGDVSKVQLRWNRILEEVSSEDEQRWRLAILEADIMLNELLDVLGYRGETMADKMKQVDRADFNTIDFAWEAHKVRNSVAHEGSARSLGAREARRVIDLYERVFREFNFVS